MNPKWTNFEKLVFNKLIKIESRLSKLEARVLMIGAASSAIVAIIGPAIVKMIWPS